MQKLQQLLAGNTESHVMPFLWVRGEPHERYAGQLDAMQEAGIREFCIEPRFYENYGSEQWWGDVAFLLEEGKRRGMGVWSLDDSHFPTGTANGEVQKQHPELRKRFLRLATFDVLGPVEGADLNLRYTAAAPGDRILGIFAQRRTEADEPDVTETVDLTQGITERADYLTGRPEFDWTNHPTGHDYGPCPVVALDGIGEGQWYVNVLYTSFEGGEKMTEGYLNPLDPAATQVLIDTIYQEFYDRFSDYFGTTFKGFFSDEARFGNIHGSEDASIGRNPSMVLPWREDLAKLLAAHLEGTCLEGLDAQTLLPYLPLLFVGDCEAAHVLRYAYMDLVSELYGENFEGVMAAWCREHGVEKIGHIIEDNNAVARLGYGSGHYFRALEPASMGGVDVVMEQLMPGYDCGYFRGFHKPGWEMAFFTYVLGKLGGSHAHLDAKKQGRCMAEVFGAYGWAEGNKLCKWMLDYMLVRGVNYFVPHAFDATEFPDMDNPPQFHAWGHNPLFDNFGRLVAYGQRVATLLTGGSYDAPVALWFNAEAEWSGSWQLMEEPARELGRATIEYDIVPTDYLDVARIDSAAKTFTCGSETFRALVLPWGEAMPTRLLEKVRALAEAKIPVFFVDGLPSRASEGEDVDALLKALAAEDEVRVVALGVLAEAACEAGLRALSPSVEVPWLRTYSYAQGADHVFFLVNEHSKDPVRCTLSGAPAGHAYVYDPFANTLVEDSHAFEIDLAPCASKLIIVSEKALEGAQPAPAPVAWTRAIELKDATLTLASMESKCEEWNEPRTLEGRPQWVSRLEGLASFSGKARYAFTLELSEADAAKPAKVELEGVSEGATLTVNGTDCGTAIVAPYAFRADGALRAGENEIVVETDNSLGRAIDDFMGVYLPNDPTGLCGATLWLGE